MTTSTLLVFQNPLLPKPTRPAHSSIAGVQKGAASACIVCARSQDDDYHATIKALNSKGRFPRKSLGQVLSVTCLVHSTGTFVECLVGIFFFWQHYMLNSEINDQLAAAAAVQEGDIVLEIGPGTGSLTNVLLNAGATVLAIEKVTTSPQIVIVYGHDYELNV